MSKKSRKYSGAMSIGTQRQEAPKPVLDSEHSYERDPSYSRGEAPMFYDKTDMNGVEIDCNAHPEIEYEHMRRMPTQRDGFWEGDNYIERTLQPPMSERVRDQVFGSIGERIGTMTSASQLTRSRGCGQTGEDGGLVRKANRKGY